MGLGLLVGVRISARLARVVVVVCSESPNWQPSMTTYNNDCYIATSERGIWTVEQLVRIQCPVGRRKHFTVYWSKESIRGVKPFDFQNFVLCYPDPQPSCIHWLLPLSTTRSRPQVWSCTTIVSTAIRVRVERPQQMCSCNHIVGSLWGISNRSSSLSCLTIFLLSHFGVHVFSCFHEVDHIETDEANRYARIVEKDVSSNSFGLIDSWMTEAIYLFMNCCTNAAFFCFPFNISRRL